MRLHVGVLGAEELLGAVDGELLDVVDEVAAAVVAAPGYPSAYLLVSTEPGASSTALLAKFSLAMSSRSPADG